MKLMIAAKVGGVTGRRLVKLMSGNAESAAKRYMKGFAQNTSPQGQPDITSIIGRSISGGLPVQGSQRTLRSMLRLMRFVARYFTALVCSWYLFTFGWLIERNRVLMYSILRHFGLWRDTEAVLQLLPVVKPSDVVPMDGPLELYEPVAANGNVTLLELTILVRSVLKVRPANLLEIGTFDGRTTLNLAANAPADARICTLDLPQNVEPGLEVAAHDHLFIDKPAPGARFKASPHASKIEQLLGDSAKFDFSPWADKVNWMFIDGAHSAEYVRNDSRIAREVIAPGGWIFWHDYGVWDGVTEALNGLKDDPWFSGLQHIEGTCLVVLKT
ncbi:MAG: class I SAM-dependent methyltransferase [Planctomycetes bacterium]|nr:class I SAM-dependent methyltransferase [Planctomycetota bacterium]